MQKLVWQNANGDTVDLTSTPYGITKWEGFANTSLNIQSQQVPFQDGGVFLDALLEQRELSVTLAMQDNGDLQARYRMRRELIHLLNPKLGEGYLIYTNDFISKRIKCVAQVPLFETHNSNDSGTPKASLAWTACEPYWEDLEETVVNLKTNEIKVLNNEGDIPAQMEIDLFTNNAVNPFIERLSDGNKIKYNGTLNKNLYINTNIGEKKVFSEDLEFNIAEYNGNINSVCYSDEKGLFVAVTDNIIFTSYDGIEWRKKEIGFSYLMRAVIYANGLFIAVGDEGKIITSENGFDWTEQTSGTINYLNTVIYGNGLYVVLGRNGTILTSSNGINWTSQTSGISNDLIGACYGNNLFVAVGDGAKILTSPDGIVWTERTGAPDALMTVTYSKELGIFVACGFNGTIITSSNGINWTSQTSGISNNNLYSITYSKELGVFVAVGEGGKIITSQDGITWIEMTSGTSQTLNSVTYGNNLFVICGNNGNILTSSNGINWTSQTSGISNNNLYSITYSKELGVFVACGYNGTILTSSNGINWTSQTSGISQQLNSVTYSKELDVFIACGNNGKIITSSNGINWINRTSGTSQTLNSVTYGNNLFVICGNNGNILTSSNGINWTSQTSGISNDLNSVFYGDGLFVACGKNGKIITSSNAITWTEQTSGVNVNLHSITYSKKYGFFIGGEYYVLISADTIKWTRKGVERSLYSITYSEELGIFVAVGIGGFITFSSDGNRWDTQTNVVSEKLNAIIYGNNLFVIGGDKKIILYSSFSQEENQIQNIDTDSDMNLNIPVGEYKFRVLRSAGNVTARITFRQKYLGV